MRTERTNYRLREAQSWKRASKVRPVWKAPLWTSATATSDALTARTRGKKIITPCPCQGKPTCRQRPSRRANLTRSSSCGDLLTGFEEESVLDLWSDIERDHGQSVEREPEKCWGCRCIMLQSEQTHVGPSYCSNACAMSSGGGHLRRGC